jgi:transcriptional regulator of acetoin/glycerol metabolism
MVECYNETHIDSVSDAHGGGTVLPSVYPYDRQMLQAAWTQFIEQETIASSACLDPAITRSWRYCRDVGLDPRAALHLERCDAATLEQRRQTRFDLIAIARPFMEDIYQFTDESDMIVHLTDEELYVLDCLGDETLWCTLRDIGFDQGARLAEEQIGTNAAAMALSQGLPAQIVGPEHFCLACHSLTNTAAPIHAPPGEMMGVIAIVTLESDSYPHTLSIVMATAQAIENQLQAEQSFYEAVKHLAELNAALQAMNRGIMFLGPEGWVTHINIRAGDILGIPRRLATGRRLSDLIGLPAEVETAMAFQISMAESEVVCQGPEGPRSCLMGMDVLQEDSHLLGFILVLEHTAKAQRLAHRVAGTRAHFTFDDILGQDLEMRRLIHYGRTIAQSDSAVLLGESGTGKELFAQAIHSTSRRADGPFVAIDCGAIPRELMAGELFGYEGAFAVGGDCGAR